MCCSWFLSGSWQDPVRYSEREGMDLSNRARMRGGNRMVAPHSHPRCVRRPG
jgi:hypothetical protein